MHWIVHSNAERRPLLVSRFPSLNVTARLAEALDDPRVSAVVVATPASAHATIAAAALRAGKHVLCEKPLATSSADCQMLVSLAREGGLVLMNGLVYLFNAGIADIKRRLDAGVIGRPRYASAIWANAGPIRDDVDVIWDLASHEIAIFNDLFGAPPLSVSGVARDFLGRGLADVAFITLHYPGEVTVGLTASWLHPHKVRQLSIVGELGMLSFDDLASAPAVEPLATQAAAFLQAIERGNSAAASGEQGWDVVRALETISASASAGGRTMPVPLRAEVVPA